MKLSRKNSAKGKGRLSANVSTLKTHLGRYLKSVRQGAEVIVFDRQLPVARLIAFTGDNDEKEPLIENAPQASWSEVLRQFDESDKRRPATKLKKDSLSYLNEDRGNR